ncbi:MAG TPA: sigma factor-like helix-turn-helix DNA-binding protein, partial [Candidatus Aminicenantes bacterium]|nr:sigma factor-like helix-turn-helix DNA-binding protein [Candidatus Aminicenantes bacterium]
PPRGRVVLILKHSEGLSYGEIAQVMETTPSAVESLLSRSRKQLFERLKTLQETTKGFPVSRV